MRRSPKGSAFGVCGVFSDKKIKSSPVHMGGELLRDAGFHPFKAVAGRV